ncbi:MAG: hypothetical protein QUS33_08960 [Dehalococcoidia bacterium]|nr:hypothetical protein [Dehalococcoidia bacterium]
MNRAFRIALLLMLAVFLSTPGLGVKVFGISICEKPSDKIATLERILVNTESDTLVVTLKPTSLAKPGYTYTVDLYERGSRRATATVVWTQTQVNVQESQSVSFSISSQEADEYALAKESQLRKTFTVQVHD